MNIPYISSRLYRQIYFTVVACLLAIIAVLAIAAFVADRADFRESPFDTTAQLARLLVPPADMPLKQIREQIDRVGTEINMDVSLYGPKGQLVAAHGDPGPKPRFNRFEEDIKRDGWQFGRRGRLIMKLKDGRWLVVDRRHTPTRRGLFGLLVFLGLIGVGIGLGAWPFVRRLTGRLETLQAGVDKVGAGDLSTRVKVEGKDEIASLATSFNTAAAKIERLVNSNRQLLANASHELRTPLARVRMGVEMLKGRKDSKRQAALEQDIAELDSLIDEILLMSRLDTNAQPQMNEIVDVLALAAEEVNRYENCSLEGDVCEVKGNSKLLNRALRNLIDNAFKHGKAPVSVSIETANDTVTIAVSDKGDGIAEELQEKVFQPFYRAPGKQNVEGYGLGLALVKQIAEAHGGSVLVNADKDDFTVSITLPRYV